MERPPDVARGRFRRARGRAARRGSKAIVTGSVAKVAGAYTVSVQLMSSAVGRGARGVSRDRARLDGAHRRRRPREQAAAASHRRVAPRRCATCRRSTQATTASLAALGKFTEATSLTLAGKRTEAIRALRAGDRDRQRVRRRVVGVSHGATSRSATSARAPRGARQAVAPQGRDCRSSTGRFIVASYAYGARRLRDGHRASIAACSTATRTTTVRSTTSRSSTRTATSSPSRRACSRGDAQIDSTIANFYFGIEGNQLLQGKFARVAANARPRSRAVFPATRCC